jgi:hypothetical protein
MSDGTRTRDRLEHNQELRRSPGRGISQVIAAIPVVLRAARRLPGVYAGAQPRLSADERPVRDIRDFQRFRVLEAPRSAAVRSPEHDS